MKGGLLTLTMTATLGKVKPRKRGVQSTKWHKSSVLRVGKVKNGLIKHGDQNDKRKRGTRF